MSHTEVHCVNPALFLYITILVGSLAIQTEEHGKGDNFTPKTENRLWSISEKLPHCYICKHNVQYHVHEEVLQYKPKIFQTFLN